jgi:hypothetical protein
MKLYYAASIAAESYRLGSPSSPVDPLPAPLKIVAILDVPQNGVALSLCPTTSSPPPRKACSASILS